MPSLNELCITVYDMITLDTPVSSHKYILLYTIALQDVPHNTPTAPGILDWLKLALACGRYLKRACLMIINAVAEPVSDFPSHV
jgi:hypothetical protein